MTCASHVAPGGRGFAGQLGIFSDNQRDGHTRLATAIKKTGSLAVIQRHHAGIRSPKELVPDQPVGPSAHESSGSRAMTHAEVLEAEHSFIAAAERALECGYDGVELHGAHGYLLCQFLSEKYNRREDEFGGSFENRSRLLRNIVEKVRSRCGPGFLIGVRLSPERFGMDLGEIKTLCNRFVSEDLIDFLDISLWDINKVPEEESYKDKTLLEHFTEIDFGTIKWTVAGQLRTGKDVQQVLDAGVDFATIGRSAILHHDFPERIRKDRNFKPVDLPVSEAYLRAQGLGDDFIRYMGRWPGFVSSK
jgi:2,4-dienoyl-CoA reductase-like NADH-dependent reductase (Old Yellow Enzyme family)